MLRVGETFDDSDTGRARRENEDARLARAPLFVVADGMGGAQAGEVASRIAIETFERGLPDAGSTEERLAALAREANRRIHELALSDPRRAGMGTTLTAAYVGEDEVAVAHVGDSRAYRLRGGGLERLTRDHSLVEELVRQGRLSADEAEEHPQRSIITRALGPEPEVDVETRTHGARDDDVYLICSDGLTSMVPEQRVAELLAAAGSLRDAGRALIDAANAAGGRDNITVVLFRLEQVSGPALGAEQPTTIGAPAPDMPPPPARRAERASAPRRLSVIAPRHRGKARGGPRSRRGIALRALLATAIVVALLAIPAWIASQQIYFVGTNANGIVTIYQGFPYTLPFGFELYSTAYVSAVPADEVAPARRAKLLDHSLRSQSDASSLVRQLERGEVAGQ